MDLKDESSPLFDYPHPASGPTCALMAQVVHRQGEMNETSRCPFLSLLSHDAVGP